MILLFPLSLMGYHVYRDSWKPVKGEELQFVCEPENKFDTTKGNQEIELPPPPQICTIFSDAASKCAPNYRQNLKIRNLLVLQLIGPR